MFRKKLKQIGAVFLAFCMVSGAVWTPGIGADAADTALTDFVNGLTAPTIAPGGAAINMPGNLPSGCLIIFCVVEKLHKANRTYKAKCNKYSELHIAATCIFMFNML